MARVKEYFPSTKYVPSRASEQFIILEYKWTFLCRPVKAYIRNYPGIMVQ